MMNDRTEEVRRMEERLDPEIKREIHEVFGEPCPNCGSFNINVRTKDGETYHRGSKNYKPEDVESVFCNMCDHKCP